MAEIAEADYGDFEGGRFDVLVFESGFVVEGLGGVEGENSEGPETGGFGGFWEWWRYGAGKRKEMR